MSETERGKILCIEGKYYMLFEYCRGCKTPGHDWQACLVKNPHGGPFQKKLLSQQHVGGAGYNGRTPWHERDEKPHVLAGIEKQVKGFYKATKAGSPFDPVVPAAAIANVAPSPSFEGRTAYGNNYVGPPVGYRPGPGPGHRNFGPPQPQQMAQGVPGRTIKNYGTQNYGPQNISNHIPQRRAAGPAGGGKNVKPKAARVILPGQPMSKKASGSAMSNKAPSPTATSGPSAFGRLEVPEWHEDYVPPRSESEKVASPPPDPPRKSNSPSSSSGQKSTSDDEDDLLVFE